MVSTSPTKISLDFSISAFWSSVSALKVGTGQHGAALATRAFEFDLVAGEVVDLPLGGIDNLLAAFGELIDHHLAFGRIVDRRQAHHRELLSHRHHHVGVVNRDPLFAVALEAMERALA